MTHSEPAPLIRGLASDISWTSQCHDPMEWPEMYSWLSPSEKEAVAAYRSEKRRTEFVLGRAAARRLIAERLDIPPADVELRIADDGAVEVPGVDLNLSISHAGGWATAVVSPRRVGMDMERLAPRSPSVYRYFLAPEEYLLLEDTDLDHDRIQILLWTLKEAVLKGMRTGLRISPKDVTIMSMGPGTEALLVDPARGRWHVRWTFWRDCYLAVADNENLP